MLKVRFLPERLFFVAQKMLRVDRTVADWKNVALATRRRHRILQAGFYCTKSASGHHSQKENKL